MKLQYSYFHAIVLCILRNTIASNPPTLYHQVQALRLKLASLRGRLTGLVKRLDESEGEKKRMSELAAVLRTDLDTVRKETDGLRLEKDKTKNALR